MKTRTKLKITVIAMLVETILLAFKQPILYNISAINEFDQGLATTIMLYYAYWYKWVKVICYAFFLFWILKLEKEYKHKIFGHFFVADFGVCVLDASVLVLLMYAPELATNVRHYTEVVIALMTVATSFFAGTFLYSKIHSPAFKDVRTAYRLWALRYFIYMLVLGLELILHNFNNVGYMQMGATTWWVVLSWVLRMPLLIVSRIYLYIGVSKMKSAKEQHEENKKSGKSHHHHHHHHRGSSLMQKSVIDDMEQTCDS